MARTIVGRKAEIATLNRLNDSNKSEFLALYGRRRVGKTFLIKEFFKNEFAFYMTGVANASTKEQLLNFDLQLHQLTGTAFQNSDSWLEAFFSLSDYLSKLKTKKKKVVFLDELPWLDTKGSDFIIGLDYFWNQFADTRNDIFLIVCGSAASWMINNLIHNRGGLHNRLTSRMKIYPFNASEVSEFLQLKGCQFTAAQIVEMYMTTGGIPYYLDAIEKGKSAAQNIQQLYFNQHSVLRTEFHQLYKALFKKHEIYEKVVETLASKNSGLNRTELIQKGKFNSGGTLTKVLSELEESGFITSYNHLSTANNKTIYRLSDFYTAFYFRFLKNYRNPDKNYWLTLNNQPKYNTWKGLAFEQFCLYHIDEIKRELGISGIHSSHYAWYGEVEGEKAQIDFIIDRNDNVINIIECKFTNSVFSIDQNYAQQLRRKIAVFQRKTKTKKSIFLTMITVHGLNRNALALELIQNEIVVDSLFEKIKI